MTRGRDMVLPFLYLKIIEALALAMNVENRECNQQSP